MNRSSCFSFTASEKSRSQRCGMGHITDHSGSITEDLTPTAQRLATVNNCVMYSHILYDNAPKLFAAILPGHMERVYSTPTLPNCF